jgi:hypothetical protein
MTIARVGVDAPGPGAHQALIMTTRSTNLMHNMGQDLWREKLLRDGKSLARGEKSKEEWLSRQPKLPPTGAGIPSLTPNISKVGSSTVRHAQAAMSSRGLNGSRSTPALLPSGSRSQPESPLQQTSPATKRPPPLPMTQVFTRAQTRVAKKASGSSPPGSPGNLSPSPSAVKLVLGLPSPSPCESSLLSSMGAASSLQRSRSTPSYRPSAQYSWSGSGQWKVRRLPPLQHPEWNGAVAGLSSGSGDPVMSHFIPDWVALNAKEPPRPKSKSK